VLRVCRRCLQLRRRARSIPDRESQLNMSGFCLNSLVTAWRTVSANSLSGFPSITLGNKTVTNTSRPLLQLKPTCGLMPVAFCRSSSTAALYLKPSVNVLMTSHPARPIARTASTAIRDM
jgi:hypothetical protein